MWESLGLIVVLGIVGFAVLGKIPEILRQAKEKRELEREILGQIVSVLETELQKRLPNVPLKRCEPNFALDLGQEVGEGFEAEIQVDRDIIVFFGEGHEHFPFPVNWPGSDFETKGAACREITTVLDYTVECFSSKD